MSREHEALMKKNLTRATKMTQNRKYQIALACLLLLIMLPLPTLFSVNTSSSSFLEQSNLSGISSSSMGTSRSFHDEQLVDLKEFALDELSNVNAETADASRAVEGEPKLPETLDIGKLFKDNLAGYQKVWEPWLSKAAIHDIEIAEDGEFLLVGGGYLYDNEIHVYRWNEPQGKYVRVWESGDDLITGDIFSVAMGDTDNNNFIEVAAASGDGHVYVFEQTHIYDPFTRTETRFDPVWVSPDLGQVWGMKIDDTDRDFLTDIIVGSWDGYVRWYEYRDHSGYPFSKEHWIEYREVFRYPIEGHIQSLTTTDLNGNGLPEIIVGTREGMMYVLENNGTVIDIEGQPFPLTRDNNYQLIWKNTESLWNPVMKLATGQLDDDREQEVVVTARGQGVYVLDYDPEADDFVFSKLTIPLESWETPASGAGYPLDHHVDWMVNSSGTVLGWDGRPEPNDYADPNGSPGFSPTIFPYNTALAQAPDNNYTLFDASASGTMASAVLDFGNDEELTGDGRPGVQTSRRGYDLFVYFNPSTPPISSRMTFYVSADGDIWEEIPNEGLLVVNSTMLFVDVDSALSARQWSGAQYLNITVHSNGYFKIDAITTRLLNRPLDTATSAIVGGIHQEWDNSEEPNKIVVGTVDGKVLVYRYDNELGITEKIFDSHGDERYTLGGNIWDIAQVPVNKRSTTPTFKTVGDPLKFHLNTLGGFNRVYTTTWAKLHEISDVNPSLPDYIDQKDLIVTMDDQAYILRGDDFTYSSALTNRYFANINSLSTSELSIAFSTDTTSYLAGIPRLAAVATNPLGTYHDPSNPYTFSNAKITLYKIYGPTSAYIAWQSLEKLEYTGYLKTVLAKSQVLPTMAFGDMNGDGLEDIIVANGKLHLLRSNGLVYYLDDDYFAEINMKTSEIFSNPQLVDFDNDGDLDLMLSLYDSPGIAYWINTGTTTDPSWEFRQQDLINLNADTNLAYNNFTLFSVEHGQSFNDTRRMLAYQTHSTGLAVFEADFETHDTFILGINPKLSRIDINIREGTNAGGLTVKNFGYRILETWNTDGELKKWTQSISIADMDDDGKREVIAGDFDNNIYVFEHLSNNTYKRAYRSPDLTQAVNTTQSPYAHEQLLGISASFIRFNWQHVDLLAAGVDTDRDGRQEFIATAGLTIYVFEFTGRDDRYQLSWTTDLGATIWKSVFRYLGITQFSALRTSKDLNYNGYGEFLVAAGPFLFIFESYGNNKYREIFMDSSLRLLIPGTHYFLPENGLLNYFATYDGSSKLIIRDVAVGNIIKDTPEQELIIVGEIQKIWGHEHGFAYIMKNVGSTFYHVTELPESLTKFNPIYTVELDDQDYDGNIDIIIGHQHGVDVYEARLRENPAPNQAPFVVQRQAILSGSPNYPYISPLYAMRNLSKGITLPPNIKNNQLLANFIRDFGVIFTKDRFDARATEMLALHTSLGLPNKQGYLPKGSFIQVFTKKSRLHWAYSTDNGATWKQQGQLFTLTDYRNQFLPQEAVIISEQEPALYQAPSGWILLSWSLVYDDPNTGKTYSAIVLGIKWLKTILGNKDGTVDRWRIATKVISEPTTAGSYLTHPSIFPDPSDPDSTTTVGVSFINVVNSTVFITKRDLLPSGSTTVLNVVPFIGITGTSTFRATSIDVLYQTHGVGNGTYVLAFSGEKYSETKGDLDIWITTANQSFAWTTPVRVSDSLTTDAYPDLTQLNGPTGTLMVVWDLQDREMQGEIGVSYSKTGGRTWREPETLSSIPEFMEFRFFPILGMSLPVWKTFPVVVFGNFLVSSPTITALPDGGFTYAYVVSYDTFLLQIIPVNNDYLEQSATNFAQSSQGLVTFVPLTPPSIFYDFYHFQSTTSTGQSQEPMTKTNADYSQATLGYRSLTSIDQGLNSSSRATRSPLIGGTRLAILGQVSIEQILSLQEKVATISSPSIYNWRSADNEEPSTQDYINSNYNSAYESPNQRQLLLPSRAAGTYRNIFTGRNFEDFWQQFDFFEASNIAVGDSDGDGRREIAFTSRNQVFLVELSRTSPYKKYYQQTWSSGDLGFGLTDIQLYDGNGNGFEEILISGEMGNVLAFEVDNLNLDRAAIQFITSKRKSNLNWNETLTSSNHELLASFDANGDGLDELVVFDMNSSSQYLHLYVNGNPNSQLTLAINGIVTKTATLDINDDDIIDFLAFGTDKGYFAVINLTQALLENLLTRMHPQGNADGTIKGLYFQFNSNSATNWTLVVISSKEIISQDLNNDIQNWNVASSAITGYLIKHGNIGTFKINNTDKDASIAIIDDHANIIFLDGNDGTIINAITLLNNSNIRKILFTSDDLNGDGTDELIVALDGEQLLTIDPFNASITWNVTNFREGESFRNLRVANSESSGNSKIYLISDSSFNDALETTIETSFETYFNDTNAIPGTPISAVEIPNVKQVIGNAIYASPAQLTNISTTTSMVHCYNIPSCPVYPTRGYMALLGPRDAGSGDYSFGLSFKNPISRISFRITYNISAGLSIVLFNEKLTETVHVLNLTSSLIPGTKLEFKANEFGVKGFGAMKIVPQTIGFTNIWYLDELEYDVLQPRIFLRQFSPDGSLAWKYSAGAQQVNSFQIHDNPEGLTSPIGLIGLSVDDSIVTSRYDIRGLLAINLQSGHPSFYGGIQENTKTGITGRMIGGTNSRPIDGTFFLTNGSMFVFQFLDLLSTETLENVSISHYGNWKYKLASPIEVVKAADLNSDGTKDIVAVTLDGYVYAIDGHDDTNVLWKTRLNPSPTDVVIGDFVSQTGTKDIFISFKDGTVIVLNGSNGLTAWKDVLIFNEPVTALNIGDRNNDAFDEIALGTKIIFSSTNLGQIMILDGKGDGSGNKRLLSSKTTLNPIVKMQLADGSAGSSNDHIIALGRDGLLPFSLYGFQITGTSLYYASITSFFAIMDFDVAKFSGSADGLVAVTVNSSLLYYSSIHDLTTGPTSIFDLSTITGQVLSLPHLVESHDRNNDDNDDTVTIGLIGFGYVSINTASNTVLWVFKDASIRTLVRRNTPFVNPPSSSSESQPSLLVTNAEIAYILSGSTGSLRWMTALPFISGDITSTFIDSFSNGEDDSILIGSEEGYIIRFNLTDSEKPTSLPLFVPWFDRYQNTPLTPSSLPSIKDKQSNHFMAENNLNGNNSAFQLDNRIFKPSNGIENDKITVSGMRDNRPTTNSDPRVEPITAVRRLEKVPSKSVSTFFSLLTTTRDHQNHQIISYTQLRRNMLVEVKS